MRTDLAAEDCVLSDHDESSMGRREGDTSVFGLDDGLEVEAPAANRKRRLGGQRPVGPSPDCPLPLQAQDL